MAATTSGETEILLLLSGAYGFQWKYLQTEEVELSPSVEDNVEGTVDDNGSVDWSGIKVIIEEDGPWRPHRSTILALTLRKSQLDTTYDIVGVATLSPDVTLST